jgi:hypothetical protein
MSQLVKRDPYARTELHRAPIAGGAGAFRGTCSWCGRRADRPARLYSYWIEHDSVYGRRDQFGGVFCSNACFRAYHHQG